MRRNLQLACANGVQVVEPHVPFKIFIFNISGVPMLIFRNQRAVISLKHPTASVTVPLTTGDIFVVMGASPWHESLRADATAIHDVNKSDV